MSELEETIASDLERPAPVIEEEAPAADLEAPTSEPAPEPPAPDPVAEALTRFEDRLGESQRLLARQTEIAAALHAENQQLQAGQLRQAQTALVSSVLRVLDDIGQMARTAKAPESREDLAMVAESLIDALARNGIDRVDVDPGAPFNARAHKIAAIEDTADPAADRTVAYVVRPGFAWSDGTTIRIADVAVLRHAPVETAA